jgi:hypothetical protein
MVVIFKTAGAYLKNDWAAGGGLMERHVADREWLALTQA